MGKRGEPRIVESQSTDLIHFATSAPYPAKEFYPFSIRNYSFYSHFHTSIEILIIEHSLKMKKE
jgi:hypothetical protein